MASTRTTWLSGLGITAPDTTIDFESGIVLPSDSVLGVELLGALTITSSTGGYANLTTSSGDVGHSSIIDSHALAIDEGDTYTFTFSSDITYLSFYLMDHYSNSTITINYSTGSSVEAIPTGVGTSGYNGIYWALISDEVISSVSIYIGRGGDGCAGIDNIEFGAVSASEVPEPSTFILLGIGLLGSSVMGRRFCRRS